MKTDLVAITSLRHLTVLVIIMCKMSSAEYFSNQTRDFSFLRGEIESLTRQSRFLSFETLDEDLKIALEFIVPFINVPVQKTMNAASGMAKSMANINLAAIALTGVTVIAGVSAASGLTHLVKLITGKKPYSKELNEFNDINYFNQKNRKSNIDENGKYAPSSETPLTEILDNIEAVFKEYDIDITTCVQKTICLLIQESAKKVSRGIGTSTNKIVDGLTGMNWLLTFLTGTAIRDAIDSGRSNIQCRLKYQGCTWSDNNIKDFIQNM